MRNALLGLGLLALSATAGAASSRFEYRATSMNTELVGRSSVQVSTRVQVVLPPTGELDAKGAAPQILELNPPAGNSQLVWMECGGQFVLATPLGSDLDGRLRVKVALPANLPAPLKAAWSNGTQTPVRQG